MLIIHFYGVIVGSLVRLVYLTAWLSPLWLLLPGLSQVQWAGVTVGNAISPEGIAFGIAFFCGVELSSLNHLLLDGLIVPLPAKVKKAEESVEGRLKAMPIPPEINAIVQRLNQELTQTEQEASAAVSIVRNLLNSFPNNEYLIQVFASISNSLFFVQVQQTRVQGILSRLQPDGVSREIIQEAGEELGAILGQVMDVKIDAASIRRQLEELL